MNDFGQEPEALIRAEVVAAERVIRSGWYILGKELTTFENQWAAYSGSNFAVGLANGMDAIECGLRILGIGAGDEVITTPMTAFATVLAVLRTGATPVLADIDPETALLDLESIQRCLSAKTKAVIPVHLYGRPCDLAAYKSFCENAKIFLLEDCAQAHGARSGDYKVGTAGQIGAWSFYPTKNLGACGDAGAMTCGSEGLANKARVLRNYGQSVRYYHPIQGFNSRLDEIQAAILSERLAYLERFTVRRQEIAQSYFERITNPSITTLRRPGSGEHHVHHLFVLRSSARDQAMARLKEQGVESLIHYPVPVHKQESVSGIKIDPKGLSATEHHASVCFSIPCYPGLTNDQTADVCNAVNSI